jgi:hypothetical protein
VLVAGRSIPVKEIQLLLPVAGLQVLQQTPQAAFVQVKSCTVKLVEPPTAAVCPITLQLTRPDPSAPWKVTGVSIP